MKKVTIAIELNDIGESKSVWARQSFEVNRVLEYVMKQIEHMLDTESTMIHGRDTTFTIKGCRNATVRIGSKLAVSK